MKGQAASEISNLLEDESYLPENLLILCMRLSSDNDAACRGRQTGAYVFGRSLSNVVAHVSRVQVPDEVFASNLWNPDRLYRDNGGFTLTVYHANQNG